MNYIKKYVQGFLYGIMFNVVNSIRMFPWNDEVWKHWLAFVLVLPVVLYFLSDFTKDFTKVRFFSKESMFMYIFTGLGIISCLFVGIIIGVI